ncbi:hypothetical protein DFH28DRAFT_937473 [Melampsora americana]|nr:hypothetical protein DFH28DRAFT_937473 [Melampsora americana]
MKDGACRMARVVSGAGVSYQHRIDALDLKAGHENIILRTNTVHSLLHKLETAEKTQMDNQNILDVLGVRRAYTHAYFAAQWHRQKQIQAEFIGDTNVQQLENQIEELIEYEEDLREAKTLAGLPGHIAFLEEEVERVSLELGGDMFRNIPDASDPSSRLLIQVKVAKSKLYEAKVGIIELLKKWETGTSMQDRMKGLMTTKQKAFKKKWKTFHDLVSKYNVSYPSDNPLINYTLEECKALPLNDTFWNFGHLTHPDEDWATDPDTQKGIQAYLLYSCSKEELRRISHEVRQILRWSLATEANIQKVLTLSNLTWDPTAVALPIDLVTSSTARMTKTVWEDCTLVLESSYHSLILDHARLFFRWDSHLLSLLHRTRGYCGSTIAKDNDVDQKWRDMIRKIIG